jgi:glycosyltransferase involved in cell wall biosynthesis
VITFAGKSDPLLVGHPFLPTGRGECIRAAYRAIKAAAFESRLLDVYGSSSVDPDIGAEIGACLEARLSSGVNIFYINGDEIEQALAHLGADSVVGAYNILVPMWELSKYPAAWARQVERFNEVWASSAFIRDSLAPAVSVPVHHLPFCTEVNISSFLGRRYFHIPEGRYVFLFLFNFTSYIDRKNPFAGIKAFERLLCARPRADAHFVIKVSGAQQRPLDYQELRDATAPFRDRITIIDRVLTDNEMKNLLRASDCFLSLHRSEGLGRGLAEAMFLGKPVIATAYSGNMDFMTRDNSLLVDYQLIPVGPGAYPQWQGQVWADADVEQATGYMIQLVEDPGYGRLIGTRASRHLRQRFSYRAAGLHYRARLETIARGCADSSRSTTTGAEA